MIINRSFNVNKQNIKIDDLKGGVIGGIITQGMVKIGDVVKILSVSIFIYISSLKFGIVVGVIINIVMIYVVLISWKENQYIGIRMMLIKIGGIHSQRKKKPAQS